MMEKQVKVSKAKSDKKMKEATESPVPTQPAQNIDGKFFIRFGFIHYAG